MQTTTETYQTDMTEEQIHAAADKAARELAKLEADADDKRAEAERARIAFEREPTAQGHAALAVAVQKAKNAVALADAHSIAMAEIQAARTKLEQRRELAELLATEDFVAIAESATEQAEALIAEVSDRLQKLFDETVKRLTEHNAGAKRVENLCRQLGEDCARMPVSLRLITEQIGTAGTPDEHNPQNAATITLAEFGHQPVAQIRINTPIDVDQRLL